MRSPGLETGKAVRATNESWRSPRSSLFVRPLFYWGGREEPPLGYPSLILKQLWRGKMMPDVLLSVLCAARTNVLRACLFWSEPSASNPQGERTALRPELRRLWDHDVRASKAMCVVMAALCGYGVLGCSSVPVSPQTASSDLSGYTYVPIDPFPVEPLSSGAREILENLARPGSRGDGDTPDILAYFPDNATRVSVESFDAHGNVSYGVASTVSKGQRFRVTTDYTNSDTTNFRVQLHKIVSKSDGAQRPEHLGYVLSPEESLVGYTANSVSNDSPVNDIGDVVNIPLYIGIGLRMTAHLVVLDSRARIDGLGAIGVEAELRNVRGALVVQTLGVNGKSISAALPIPTELDKTTIQTAASSVGAIKALLYDEETTIYPRIVGLYLPFEADKALINAIISELSAHPPQWKRLELLGAAGD